MDDSLSPRPAQDQAPHARRRREAERHRTEALLLWRSGASADEISRRLNITRAHAVRIIRSRVDAVLEEARAEDLRARHTGALMDVWQAIHPASTGGDLGSVDRFLRLERRLGALRGLGQGVPAPAPAD